MEIKKFFVMHALMALVFLISGLVTNMLQGILYLALYNVNRRLYRKINYYLIYTSWSQIVAMTEWWSGCSCYLYGKEEDLKHFGKEHCIVVMNHKYDVDWLMCWVMCDKLKMLGSAKTCAKTSLRYMPVIGWGWVFGEMVFLERDWEKDRLTLGEKLDRLVAYDDPVMILFFCEGTRFTPEKHKASMKFAEEHNLPKLKHHLLPRTKGFNFSASHLKNKIQAIYDVQLAFPNQAKPTFSDVLQGEKFVGHMHIRRIPINEIPTDSEEATSAWLYKFYEEKDELMDNYMKTNTFPGKSVKHKRRIVPLLNAFFWLFMVGVPFLYFMAKLLLCGTLWVQALTVTGLVLVFTATYMMIGATKADKGSSYGMNAALGSTPKNNGVGDTSSNGEVTSCGTEHGTNLQENETNSSAL